MSDLTAETKVSIAKENRERLRRLIQHPVYSLSGVRRDCAEKSALFIHKIQKRTNFLENLCAFFVKMSKEVDIIKFCAIIYCIV